LTKLIIEEKFTNKKGLKESRKDFSTLSESKIKCNKINNLQSVDAGSIPDYQV